MLTRDIVTMSECDFLDLAKVSNIQGQGFLVVVYFDNGASTCIRNVSSNIGEASFSARALRHDPKLFIGKCISQCFSDVVVEEMSTLIEKYTTSKTVCSSFTCDISELRYMTTLARSRHGFVFEILPNNTDTFDATSHARDIQMLVGHTKLDKLFEAVCTIVTDTISYDRSLVYQFQDDLSGKVVYEKVKPSLVGTIDSYQGLYFPESDIPLPAREMFLIRPIRVIFDNEADSVDVVGRQQDEKPDLSRCTLRANHPVHASYMKNMGLRSSMSIGIVVDSQLWGLVCFHAHDTARHPEGGVTTFLESLSIPLSVCISNIHKDDYEKRQVAFSTSLYSNLSNTDIFGFFAVYAPDLLVVLQADCVSIRIDDRVKSWGDADLVASTCGVEKVSREAVGKDWAIGELSHPSRGVISMVHGDLTVVFIRKSVSIEKVWAGDPSHRKIRRPDGVLGPRASFERYVQSGVDSLNKWNTWDKKLASHVSSRIRLFVTTIEFFTEKTNALLHQAHATSLKGNVEYTTAAKLSTPKPIFDTGLVSHFSHALKTPLHGISSALTLIESQPAMTRDVLQGHIGDAQDSVRNLTRTVNSLLSIAAGVDDLSSTSGNLEKASLEEIADSLRHQQIDNENFTVTSTVDSDHDLVMINSSILHDTLMSIIHSSLANVDATTGSVHVSVSRCSTHREATMAWMNDTQTYSHRNIRNSEEALSRISDTDSWFTFSVRDSGCGIHGDMIDNVLAYSDSTRKTTALTNSHQGVEIDVYKCISNVIFDMNGSIGIASTVSEGTTISLMLPAQVIEIDNAPFSDLNIDPEKIGVFYVVDDNTVNRKLAAKLVKVACTKTFGVAPVIKEFSDGRFCVEEIKKMRDSGNNIMGILMDYHMPVMSGKEATTLIRQIEKTDGLSKVPIFGFTADSTDTTKEDLVKSGMDDVLPKPLSMKMLQDACISMLSR